MAIQIVQKLQATPNPTTLPRRIDFKQTLRSNRDGEQVTVEYSLDAGHNIWFQDSSGQPAKKVQRTETVTRQGQPCHDRITLQEGPGSGPLDLVQVNQTITDSSGVAIPDVCVIQIER